MEANYRTSPGIAYLAWRVPALSRILSRLLIPRTDGQEPLGPSIPRTPGAALPKEYGSTTSVIRIVK